MTEPDAALLARMRSLIDSDARPRHPLPLRAMRIAITCAQRPGDHRHATHVREPRDHADRGDA